MIAADIETVSEADRRPVGIGIAVSPTDAFYFPDLTDEAVVGVMATDCDKVFHNISFDMEILADSLGFMPNNWHDTKMMAFNEGILDTSLHHLAFDRLDMLELPSVTSLWTGKQKTNEGIDPALLAPICCKHALATYRLAKLLPRQDVYTTIDMPFVPILLEMRRNGVAIDLEELERQEDIMAARVDELAAELKAAGFRNPMSPKLLPEDLASMDIPLTKKTKKTRKPSTSEASLAMAKHLPIIQDLLEYKALRKILSTYLRSFKAKVDGGCRLHTSFKYTETARLRSSKPNLQNITRGELRRIIGVGRGYVLLSIDFSQLELRVAAMLSGDRAMLKLLSAEDLHGAMALAIFGTLDKRYEAKTLNFAVLFGAAAELVASMTGLSVHEATTLTHTYFVRFPRLKEWIGEMRSFALDNGYCETFFGRIRVIPEMNAGSKGMREHGLKVCVNTPIQGTAVDIVKLAMLDMRAALPPEVRFVLQVHDEVVLEIPEAMLMEVVRTVDVMMRNRYPMYPVKMASGYNYYDLEEVRP